MGSPVIRFKGISVTCEICGRDMSDQGEYDEYGDIIFNCCEDEDEINN